MSKWAMIAVMACSGQMLFLAAQVDTAAFCLLSIELAIAAAMGFYIWRIYQKKEESNG